MEDDLSKTFMEFEELYTEDIIHQNILVEFACILHPKTFPEKPNPFLVLGRVSSIWICSSVWGCTFSVWRCGYYLDECVLTNESQL